MYKSFQSETVMRSLLSYSTEVYFKGIRTTSAHHQGFFDYPCRDVSVDAVTSRGHQRCPSEVEAESPSAAHTNDETLLVIHSPQLAKHFTREMDRLWNGAELGITPHIQRKLDRQKIHCGDGVERG